MSSPSNPRPDQQEQLAAALIAEHLRLSRNSFKLGHRLRGLPDPDLPDLREQAAAEVYEAFHLSGPEDPAIDPEARDLIERIQARVLATMGLASE